MVGATVIDVAVTCAFGGAAALSLGWLIGKGVDKNYKNTHKKRF